MRIATIAAFAAAACATAPDAPAPMAGPHDELDAVAWMQTAVEYDATTASLFALAQLRLDEALDDRKWTARPDLQSRDDIRKLPPAVIIDVDETVLDNSAYQGGLIRTGATFNGLTWNDFVDAKVSTAIPGAREFVRYAKKKGVRVYYVTNRDFIVEQATRDNLEAEGFELPRGADVVLTIGENGWTSKKGARVAAVAATHRILLMIGDNLGDFTDATGGTPADRDRVFADNAGRWGREWIAIPNPIYGSWESALAPGDLPEEEKRRRKVLQLKAWTPAPND